MRRHQRITTGVGAVLALLLGGCGHSGGRVAEEKAAECGCDANGTVEMAGTVSLRARSSVGFPSEATSAHPFWTTGYWNSAVSFERGGATGGVEKTNNDWDLVFGNDHDLRSDLFGVNTVSDDRSFIIDLGEISFRDAPAELDPLKFAVQKQVNLGDIPTDDVRHRDQIPVIEGHVYWVRTSDADSKLVTLVGVQEHVVNESVTLVWFRSKDPDRFAFDWP